MVEVRASLLLGYQGLKLLGVSLLSATELEETNGLISTSCNAAVLVEDSPEE